MQNFEKVLFGENEFADMREVNRINPSMKILTREESKIKRIIFHCTDANGWSPQRLNDFFLNERKFPTCGYHYYVTKDKLYQMVSALVVAYHAAGHNSDSISFSIDYDATFAEKLNIPMEAKLYEMAVATAALLCFKFRIYPSVNTIAGHRELFGTGFTFINNDTTKRALLKTCPGLKIDLNLFRYNVVKKIQSILKLSVDGIFGPKSKAEFDIYVRQ